ncbi:16949_t:CDS:1, partial [Dentiscutata heterogama]
ISLRCLVLIEGRIPSSQSVTIIDISNNQRVDYLKHQIKRKWPSLQEYDPSQITLHRMTEGITLKKVVSFYNDNTHKGTEMFPIDSIAVYFPDTPSDICENCIDVAVYVRGEPKRVEL